MQFVLQARLDTCQRARDLARHEGLTAHRGFVIEENAIGGVHVVRLSVVNGDPVRVNFSRTVRRARVKRCGFLLRYFLHLTEHLRGRCLVDARRFFHTEQAHRFQYSQGT